MDLLRGLDLFSGIGGLTLALGEWSKPVAYCENDRHAQAVLLSRMGDGRLPRAPIWDDVTSLTSTVLPSIDIIYGGFPCQDISAAGRGAGLGGERSGLFFEVVRLAKETRAPFVFLENVPAIRTRGLREVLRAFTDLGYDCRWTCVSARDVGAPHLRKRWFMLARRADADRDRLEGFAQLNGQEPQSERQLRHDTDRLHHSFSHTDGLGLRDGRKRRPCGEAKTDHLAWNNGAKKSLADTAGGGQSMRRRTPGEERHALRSGLPTEGWITGESWAVEPDVGRVADGVFLRVDRLRGLGNSVVPAQAREAFKRLAGF